MLVAAHLEISNRRYGAIPRPAGSEGSSLHRDSRHDQTPSECVVRVGLVSVYPSLPTTPPELGEVAASSRHLVAGDPAAFAKVRSNGAASGADMADCTAHVRF
jgi:hypothetical protein